MIGAWLVQSDGDERGVAGPPGARRLRPHFVFRREAVVEVIQDQEVITRRGEDEEQGPQRFHAFLPGKTCKRSAQGCDRFEKTIRIVK
jgi:hypothetical protein